MKIKKIKVDGYKNLVDCSINFGDFNLLVGPNNSGKSNFLEVFSTLYAIFLGHEAIEAILGKERLSRPGPYFCNLESYRNRDLTIEVVFDTKIKDKAWRIDYKVTIERPTRGKKDKDGKLYFKGETLKGKPPNRRGPWNVFFKRKPRALVIATQKGTKEHSMGNTISSFEIIRSVYHDVKDLGQDFKKILSGIHDLCSSNVLGLSPDLLRNDINKEGRMVSWLRNMYFDILLAVDEIHTNRRLYKSFESAVCDILDLEGIHFAGKNIYAKDKGAKEEEPVKRLRSFAIKKAGMGYNSIENYSDGTLMVIAILAALFSEKRCDSMICIEEPENYLHPRALEKLLRFLQDHADRWPVMITTHSPYLLNGVKPEDVNVAVVDENGAAHFEKIKSSRQLRDYLNKGLMSFGDLLVEDFEGFREG